MDMPLSSTPQPPAVTVRRGDTLVSLVTSHYRSQGVTLDGRQAFLMALQVAKGNAIADPSRLQPGQSVRLDGLPQPGELAAGARPAAAPAPVAWSTAQVLASRQSQPVLERTLSRAVERGFIPPQEREAVRERVERMAHEYGFDPDDFARVALIESDGLNPSASNGRCHGIIQFCGGTGRGAASVGYAANPQQIRKMSVLQQLDLVDTYFEDVGLPRGGRVSLDELYLAVLTPAARAQRAAAAPLPIAGTQARILYEGGQREAGITRRSITQGLHRHAQEQLADTPNPAPAPAPAPVVARAGAGGGNWPSGRQLIAANSLERR